MGNFLQNRQIEKLKSKKLDKTNAFVDEKGNYKRKERGKRKEIKEMDKNTNTFVHFAFEII